MGRSLAVTTRLSADDLRKLARRERDSRVSLRLIAIAAVLEGGKRQVAARQGGMDRQTLCDWVHRFNAAGVEGLRDRPHGDPVRRLTAQQEAQIRAHVLAVPDPEKARCREGRLVRWRCIDAGASLRCRISATVRPDRPRPPCARGGRSFSRNAAARPLKPSSTQC